MNRSDAINFAVNQYFILDEYTIRNFDYEKEKAKLDFMLYLQKELSKLSIHEEKNWLEKFKEDVSNHQKIKDKIADEKRKWEKEIRIARETKNAEKFSKKVKPGMIIKVKGTNDRKGYRLVMETDDFGVTCRKLSFQRKKWKKEKYITSHMWNKIKEILVENPTPNQII